MFRQAHKLWNTSAIDDSFRRRNDEVLFDIFEIMHQQFYPN